MTTSARVRLAVGVALGVAVLALGGCGRFGGRSAGGTETSDLAWDQQALQSIGFSTDEVAADDPVTGVAPSATPVAGGTLGKIHGRHRLVRFAFGRKALHGE